MPALIGGVHRAVIERELRRGLSNREIERSTGAHHHTIRRMRKRLGMENVLCECGKLATHKGWCAFRYKLHPLRKAPTPFIRLVFGVPLSKIRCREHTYRNEELARRSFYRFICKRGRYFPLRNGSRMNAAAFGGSWKRGYPKWWPKQAAQACTDMRAWRAEFDKNWPAIQDRALSTMDGRRNLELVKSRTAFFQLQAAGGLAK